jgi:hypothetical protein
MIMTMVLVAGMPLLLTLVSSGANADARLAGADDRDGRRSADPLGRGHETRVGATCTSCA